MDAACGVARLIRRPIRKKLFARAACTGRGIESAARKKWSSHGYRDDTFWTPGGQRGTNHLVPPRPAGLSATSALRADSDRGRKLFLLATVGGRAVPGVCSDRSCHLLQGLRFCPQRRYAA